MPRFKRMPSRRSFRRSWRPRRVRRFPARRLPGPTRPITAPGYRGAATFLKHFHFFQQTAVITTAPGGIPTGAGIAVNFALNQFANYANAVNMFDEYAFVGVRVRFIPTSNVAGSYATTGGGIVDGPRSCAHLCIDSDGISSVTAATVLAHDNCITKPHTSVISTGWFVPKPAVMLYNGMPTGYGSPEGRDGLNWINTTYAGVAHYGAGIYVEPPAGSAIPATATVAAYDMQVDATIKFRGGY